MSSIYQDSMNDLAKSCDQYRKELLNLSHLKQDIWRVSQDIVSISEKDLRLLLMRVEGRLDHIEHTTNTEDLRDRILAELDELDKKLELWV